MSVYQDSTLLYALLLQKCMFKVTAMVQLLNMCFKRLSFGSKGHIKELKVYSVHVFWARLASFGPLGTISDHLMVSNIHNGIQYPKRQENKIYTIVKGRELVFHRLTVPITSYSEVKYVH